MYDPCSYGNEYRIYPFFLDYLKEKPIPKVDLEDVERHRKLARRILFEWCRDLHRAVAALEKVQGAYSIRNSLHEIEILWSELHGDTMELWSSVAGINLFHLKNIFVKKITRLLESRPDLKSELASLFEK